MMDRETDPSPESATPLPSRDNTIASGDGVEPREPAVSVPARDAGEPPDDPQQGNGRPRMRVVVYPLPPNSRDDVIATRGVSAGGVPGGVSEGGAADGGVPAGGLPANDEPPADTASAPGEPLPQESSTGGRPAKFPYPKAGGIDPIDGLVEFVFPAKSLTDWLRPDSLNRWKLFGDAIAKDRAGVDEALARAREVGYTAGRFTDALKSLVADESAAKPPRQELSAGPFKQEREHAALYPGHFAAITKSVGDNRSAADRSDSSGQFAQLAFPPTLLFARPPVLPRPLRPLEELPKGSADGPKAGRQFTHRLTNSSQKACRAFIAAKRPRERQGPTN